MYRKAQPFYIVCESPLHAGSGSDLGIVDLPIQRERHTSFPKVEGSSLKGGVREAFEQRLGADDPRIKLTFGPENAEHAGALGITDARLLLFPVKSMKGVFAWITCPLVISNFIRDLKLCGINPKFAVPTAGTTPKTCNLILDQNQSIVLEEYAFSISRDEGATAAFARYVAENTFPPGPGPYAIWRNAAAQTAMPPEPPDIYDYWREKMIHDIVVLEDNDFRDFVNLSTEVITRTKINPKTGTVANTALFTEEYLPAESVLYALALASPMFVKDSEKSHFKGTNPLREAENISAFFTQTLNDIKTTQLGGNATIGKGIVRISTGV